MSCTCPETNFMDGKGHDPGCPLYAPSVVKNRSTPENAAFWDNVEQVAGEVRARRDQSSPETTDSAWIADSAPILALTAQNQALQKENLELKKAFALQPSTLENESFREAIRSELIKMAFETQDTLEQVKQLLEQERKVWCDKPEDRLYHASDKTWWKRNEKGECVRTEPPEEVKQLQAQVEEIRRQLDLEWDRRKTCEAKVREV